MTITMNVQCLYQFLTELEHLCLFLSCLMLRRSIAQLTGLTIAVTGCRQVIKDDGRAFFALTSEAWSKPRPLIAAILVTITPADRSDHRSHWLSAR